MQTLELKSYTLSTCLGLGLAANWRGLAHQHSGLKPCDFETVDLPTYIGEVSAVDAVVLPASLQDFDCRNNRLAQLALEQDGFITAVQQAKSQYGADRIGLFLGTSTAGVLQTEQAYRRRATDDAAQPGALPADFHYAQTQSTYSVAAFTARLLGLKGPALVVASACSSSAKVFANAARMMEAGLIDAAVVGGVDSLCLTTLYGFNSLQLLSTEPACPYDVNRNGISIGEGAAFALLTRAEKIPVPGTILLHGVGESSDAHHMSSPHPGGLGAQLAMQAALQAASLNAEQIAYINLHGTATPSNDLAEGKAVHALFGHETPCSSTKGATGHTLGAAGAIEAVICVLVMQNGMIPAGCNTTQIDTEIDIDYVLENRTQSVDYVLSNSFGFGGSNCSLVMGVAR